jgi:hypothetical protein
MLTTCRIALETGMHSPWVSRLLSVVDVVTAQRLNAPQSHGVQELHHRREVPTEPMSQP